MSFSQSYLYSKTISNEIIDIVKKICITVKHNRKYINGLLLETVDICNKEIELNNSISKNTFINLCSVISIEYDKSCKQLGIKRRTLAYKLNNNQIHPNKFTIIDQLVKISIYLLAFIYLFVIGYIIFTVITAIIKILNI